MDKKLLVQEENRVQKAKEIMMMQEPQRLKMILGGISWKIMLALSENEMYPLQLAKKLGIHEQKVYYHIRKLAKAGAIVVTREEEKKGATARYYRPVSTAFGIELPRGYEATTRVSVLSMDKSLREFFKEFLKKDESFEGKIVVGSPTPHGPFKTSARDGHYSSYLTFFLGQFMRMPDEFAIKLDVDMKAEKEERSNLILVGGPGTNVATQEINDSLPVKFIMHPSEQGFLLGGMISKRTSIVYTADTAGLIAKIINPWDSTKSIIVLAGNKAVGTKACVLALASFWKKTLRNYHGEDTFATVIQGFDLDSDGKVDSIEVLE
jgi:DNA-binding transcriptional ArsR family regulator